MRSPLLGRELSKWHGHISVLAVILMIVTSLYCLPLPAEETAVKGNVLGGEDLRSSQPQIGGLFVSPPYRTDWGSCLRFLIRLSSKRFCRSKTNQHGMCLSAECCSAPPFCAAGACMTSLSSGSFSELDKVMMRRGPPMRDESSGIDLFPPPYSIFARNRNITLTLCSSPMYHYEIRTTADAEVRPALKRALRNFERSYRRN